MSFLVSEELSFRIPVELRYDTRDPYAVRLTFDDLHDSGIFSWDYLYFLGSQQAELWQKYEERLAQAGASRDDPMPKAGATASACGHSH